MKFISVIISIIILALSFVPCTDSISPNQESQSLSTSHQESRNHKQHSDFCSPLCVCSCCGTVVAQIEADSGIETYQEQTSTLKESIFKQNLPTDLYYSIWEPPKII